VRVGRGRGGWRREGMLTPRGGVGFRNKGLYPILK